MKRTFKRIIGTLFFLIILFVVFLVVATIREFKPPIEMVIEDNSEPVEVLTDSTFSIMIWNIGYAGLGENMDFFYDGGKKVRDSREAVEQNFEGIADFLSAHQRVDFLLLQEVDFNSRRSYRMNQFDTLASVLSAHQKYAGINYEVDFVPAPVKSPMGKVKSGIALFSAFTPKSVIRYGFDANYSWPTRLFMLKRCFLVARYNLPNGRQLVLMNLHNSAYDDGTLRAEQLNVLEDFATEEYQQGNYVVMGGDWNQSPANLSENLSEPFDTVNVSYLPEGFLEGWQNLYADDVPTNRRVTQVYEQGKTPVTIIDYFYVSPNVKPVELRPYHLGFRFTDHNPVLLTFSLAL